MAQKTCTMHMVDSILMLTSKIGTSKITNNFKMFDSMSNQAVAQSTEKRKVRLAGYLTDEFEGQRLCLSDKW